LIFDIGPVTPKAERLLSPSGFFLGRAHQLAATLPHPQPLRCNNEKLIDDQVVWRTVYSWSSLNIFSFIVYYI